MLSFLDFLFELQKNINYIIDEIILAAGYIELQTNELWKDFGRILLYFDRAPGIPKERL